MTTYEVLSQRTSKRKRIYAHLDKLNREYEPSEVVAPVTIEIFPTNKCNSKCFFCAFPKTDLDELSEEVFEQLVNSCIKIGVQAVTFSGGGEPTVHKYLPKAIDKLTTNNVAVGLITNGVFISDELMEVINKCSWIRFSLLTAEQDEYQRLTNLNKECFVRVLENIKNVTKCKKNTIVSSTMLLYENNANIDSIYKYINLAGDLKLDQVFFSEMVEHIGSFKLNRNILEKYCDLICTRARKTGIITNIKKFLEKNEYSAKRKEGLPCGIIEHNMINLITANGNVYPCLGQYSIQHAVPMGCLESKKLEEILSKENIDRMCNIYIPNKCAYCKNTTTRNEILKYTKARNNEYVNDPHDMFI